MLRKTTYTAPINGIISYIAVRVGENVVPGIQGTAGGSILTISDMSVVTAEVMVDDTDIVNVKTASRPRCRSTPSGQNLQGSRHRGGSWPSSALPARPDDRGHRERPGGARLRSRRHPRQSADFPAPGLSATAKIQTASKSNVLTTRSRRWPSATQKELDEAKMAPAATSRSPHPTTPPARTSKGCSWCARQSPVVPVPTGITGVSNIEVAGGLQEGDVIVTGSFKALRSLKPGTSIKIDNSTPALDDTTSS